MADSKEDRAAEQRALPFCQSGSGQPSSSARLPAETLAASAASLLSILGRQSPFFQPRSLPLAALNLPFARASDPDGGGSKRKKKRIPRPGEQRDLSEREARRIEKKPKPEPEPAAKADKPEKQAKAVAARRGSTARDDDDERTPAAVRALDLVKEPPAESAAEAAAVSLALQRGQLSGEERAALDAGAWSDLARQIRVETGDGEVSLRRLARQAAQDKAVKEMSADEPTLRRRLREEVMAELPGFATRPDAPKMQLRPWEQEALDLDRLGEGHLFSPRRVLGCRLGSLHDVAWGMFGRIAAARAVLHPRWAGRNPDQVLAKQEYYDDILANANKMEMTMMMVAQRRIPLKQLRESFLDRQIRVLSLVPPGSDDPLQARLPPAHELLLARIKRHCTVKALSESGLIDAQGCIIPDSKLILTVGPQWQLSAEAITAGSLRQQKAVFLGHWRDPDFTAGVLENFLGLPPVDPVGKTSVGNGLLYVANGFDFEDPAKTGTPHQYYNTGRSLMSSHPLHSGGTKPSREVFSVAAAAPPMLLKGLQKATGSRQASA